MVKRAPIPQTDAAADIAALAAKRARPHLRKLTEHTSPASGIPAMGEGYGGPAKGAGRDLSDPSTHAPPTKARIADKNASRERMKAIIEEIAENDAVHPMVRLAAADKLLDRLEGKPVNTNLNLDGDDIDRLSDADVAAETKRLLDQVAEARAPAKSGRLPH